MGGGVLARLLGPTADVMGSQLVEWYKRTNVERVARKADAKAHTAPGGSIPPRVAAEVFDKAQWANDEFVAEYLSGVLASARTADGSDDSAVSWTALVSRMSSTQLRLHYILYSTARHHLLGRQIELTNDLEQLPIYIPLLPVLVALDMGPRGGDAFNEAITTLVREGLISARYETDTSGERIGSEKSLPKQPAMIYRLSPGGIMLFMRGGGSRVTLVKAIADAGAAIDYREVVGVDVPVLGSSLLSEMPDTV